MLDIVKHLWKNFLVRIVNGYIRKKVSYTDQGPKYTTEGFQWIFLTSPEQQCNVVLADIFFLPRYNCFRSVNPLPY